MKLTVDGKEYEYTDDEMTEVIGILREDGAVKAFSELRESNKAIIERMDKRQAEREAERAVKNAGGTVGNGGSAGNPTNSGATPPESGDGKGKVENSGEGTPEPPPRVDPGSKEPPAKKKSRWWGDALD